jgi:PKD repeat protein
MSSYQYRVVVTGTCGSVTSNAATLVVNQPPTADFTATSTSGCAPLTVIFTDASNGNGRDINGWTWDFGDTTTYSGQTPLAHIYSSPGTYTVRLTVTTACGTNTMTKTGYITAYGPPTANFTATPISGCPPMTVTFANTSNGNGRTITSWAWNFGDSTNYNGQTPPAHIYSNKGTYTVKLTVTSACGTDTKTAYVIVSQPVVVPGSYGPACVSGSSITLVGSPGGGTWFGDGVLGNIFNPAVSGPGNHVLTYQYTSGSSCSFSNTTTLTVVPLPQTTITVG